MQGNASPASSSSGDSGRSVKAVSFGRPECEHQELFQAEYKRSNRTKGLKILRCFPHCCPQHVERSYCGASLHVMVHPHPDCDETAHNEHHSSHDVEDNAEIDHSRGISDGDLHVFARFESANDNGMSVGDTVSHSLITKSAQTEDNPEGRWIPGTPEHHKTPKPAVEVGQTQTKDPLLYKLNGKVYSRWYYDWESGANKSQRLMKHVLRAYVFERCSVEANSDNSPNNSSSSGESGGAKSGSDEPSSNATSHDSGNQGGKGHYFRVLAVVASPEFTVISYRRAQNERNEAKHVAASVLSSSLPSSSHLVHPSHNYHQPPYHERRNSDPFWQQQFQSLQDHHSLSTPYGPPPKRRRHPSIKSEHASEHYDVRQRKLDQMTWELDHPSAITVSKNLALVYLFFSWTPLSAYNFTEDLQQEVQCHLVSLGLASRDKCFSYLLSSETKVGVPVPSGQSDQLEPLLRVLSSAARWMCSPEATNWMRLFFAHRADSVLHKQNLRDSFLLWIHELQDGLNHYVFASSPLKSLANVSEEVLRAVYSVDAYSPFRPKVRELLSQHTFAGWRPFVAQMRDAYVGSSIVRPMPSPQSPVERMWTGTWVVDTNYSIWTPALTRSSTLPHPRASSSEAMSLETLWELITHLSSVKLALNVDSTSISLRSALSLGDGMRLVLDGKDRVYRVLPNGVSSHRDPMAFGDYRGQMRTDVPDRLTVTVDLFKWGFQDRPVSRSFRAQLRIECVGDGRLEASAELLETTYKLHLQPGDEHVKTMEANGNVDEKLSAVHAAHAKQNRLEAEAEIAPSAWRRLGNLRLQYRKAA